MGGIIMNFFTPAEVAKNYIATGKSKVNTPIPKMIILAILAGAFIGFGGVGATTVIHYRTVTWKIYRCLCIPGWSDYGADRGK